MFRRALFLSLTFLALCAGLLTWSVTHRGPADEETLAAYTPSEEAIDNKRTLFQHRGHVAKEIWKRGLHHSLSSNRSTVEAAFEGRQPRLTEHMIDVKGTMEEEKGIVRTVDADAASYCYTERSLTARGVSMERHQTTESGEQIPLLQGKAETAAFAMGDDDLSATHFQATLFGDQVVEITADKLESIGDEFLLSGHIIIDHPEAHITAEEGVFPKQGFEKGSLYNHVEIAFAEGGKLRCWESHLDFTRQRAHFSGLLPLNRVSYKDETVALTCDDMKVTFTSDKQVSRLFATGSVELHRDDLSGSADQITYTTTLPQTHLPHQLAARYSSLSLRPFDDLIVLRGNVKLNRPHSGTLETDEEVWLARSSGAVDTILCIGKTHLNMISDDDTRTLICNGTLVIDEQTHHIVLDEPSLVALPVEYADKRGRVFAERLDIFYSPDEKGYTFDRISLAGGVQIQNNLPIEGDPLHLQYALADSVEFIPCSEQMTLSSDGDNHVVFLDPAYDTRVSADKIILNRTEQMAQGIGNVRLNLSDHEVNQLREVFNVL